MRYALLSLAVLLLFSYAVAGKEPIRPQLQFQGTAYELAFADRNSQEAINEYIPAGETLEKWTSLLAVRTYAGRRDYRELAGGLIRALREKNPLARAALHTSPDGKRTMVDFVTWDTTDEVTEFNVFIYQLSPNGNSVVCQQFAQRVYGQEAGFDYLRELKGARAKLLTAVGEFEFPAIR